MVVIKTSLYADSLYKKAYLSFFFSSRRRHTIFDCDWSSDVCSSDLLPIRGTCAGATRTVDVSEESSGYRRAGSSPLTLPASGSGAGGQLLASLVLEHQRIDRKSVV